MKQPAIPVGNQEDVGSLTLPQPQKKDSGKLSSVLLLFQSIKYKTTWNRIVISNFGAILT